MKLRDSELTAVVKSFCDTIRAGGYRPGAYGSLGNLWAKVGPSYLGDDVLVWVAAWCNSPPKMGDLWQYTDRAQAQGKNIDGDQALSDRFKALVQNKPEEEPEPAPAPTPDPDPEPQTDTFTISGIPALKKGDTGAAVIALQGELIACGYSCGGKRKWNGAEEPDGIFGNITEESVRSFQRAHNIPDTGIAKERPRRRPSKPKKTTTTRKAFFTRRAFTRPFRAFTCTSSFYWMSAGKRSCETKASTRLPRRRSRKEKPIKQEASNHDERNGKQPQADKSDRIFP